MATAATRKTLDYPHLVKTSGVRGGKARIAGTRICVVDVVAAYLQGLKPEEIREHFSSRLLSLAEVHSALAYYYDHPDEIDSYYERSKNAVEEYEVEREAHLRRLNQP